MEVTEHNHVLTPWFSFIALILIYTPLLTIIIITRYLFHQGFIMCKKCVFFIKPWLIFCFYDKSCLSTTKETLSGKLYFRLSSNIHYTYGICIVWTRAAVIRIRLFFIICIHELYLTIGLISLHTLCNCINKENIIIVFYTLM